MAKVSLHIAKGSVPQVKGCQPYIAIQIIVSLIATLLNLSPPLSNASIAARQS